MDNKKGLITKIIAHRGALLEAPENTLLAFEKAIEIGADLIELDVRATQDGVLVVIHDERVDRTTNGSGAVHKMTLAELRSLDAGSWMSAAFRGERVPTLEDVLIRLKGQVQLAIEVKAGHALYANIEKKLINLLKLHSWLDDIIIIADDCTVIKQIRALAPGLPTACFKQGTPHHWVSYQQGAQTEPWPSDYLFAWPETVSTEMVATVHKAGLKIISSLERQTTLNPTQIKQLATTGLDGILANDVRRLAEILEFNV